jgi:hypothetical protein
MTRQVSTLTITEDDSGERVGVWLEAPSTGPRMQIFLSTRDVGRLIAALSRTQAARADRVLALSGDEKLVGHWRGIAERFAEDRDVQKHRAREAEAERDAARADLHAAITQGAEWEGAALEAQQALAALRKVTRLGVV